MNLPDSSFLPAPLWLITTLHIITLSLHFAAMNFLLGGVMIVLGGRSGWLAADSAARRLIPLFPSAMAATITLGVAPLLFLQLVYPQPMYSAAIVSAWFWLLVIPAVILAYYLFYAASFRGKGAPAGTARYLVPSLGCLLFVSLVYSGVFSMAEHPGLIGRLYSRSQSGWQWNPAVGDYGLRWLHMIMGAVTVGGFFPGLIGRKDPETVSLAKRVMGYGMAAAAASGLAYLISLGNILTRLMHTPAIWALTAGVLLSLGSLHFFFKRRLLPAGLALLVSLAFMVVTRHQVRLLQLQGSFDPSSGRIAPQTSALLLFLACAAIAAVLVTHMLHLFFGRRSLHP